MARADFIFSVNQRAAGGPLEIGSLAIFDVTLARAPGFPSVNNLAGISFFVGLGDPVNWANPHPAGRLRSGTNNSANPLAGGREYLFTPADGGGFLNDDAAFLAFSVSTTTVRTLTTAPAFLGTFVLDTTGGIAGNYALMFAPNEFGLQDPASNLLPGTYTGQPASLITVTAVPEPSAWLLATLAAVALGRCRLKTCWDARPKKRLGQAR